jgi:hypothetical protein
VQPQLEQGQHLLRAGDHRHLLGRHRVHARCVEHREEVALDVGPRLLEPELGVDLVDEEPVGDLGRLRVDLAGSAVRVGQRVRGVGGQHQRPQPARSRQRGGTGSHGRLADSALAGEEEDAHGRAPR